MVQVIPFRDFQPLEMSVIVGGVRCFKTLELVRQMYLAQQLGYVVFSNVTLNRQYFPDFIQIDPKNPKRVIEQIRDEIDYRDTHKEYFPAFLGLDEFASVVDPFESKEAFKDSDIWKQLGKVGITSAYTNQAFNMTYNRVRNFANVMRTCKRVNNFIYTVYISVQNPRNFEEYVPSYDFHIDARKYFPMYDTHQVMYLRAKSAKTI